MEAIQMSSTDESIKNIYIYNGILISYKKDEILPFAATWMALKIIILNKVGQEEKNKYHMISLICRIFFLMI